jgi:O-antigen ligase
LPGRAAFVAVFEQAGVALPWLPISLDPAATSRAWLALLPAVAVFLATLHLGLRARRSLSLLIIALGLVSVLLGLAQLMQGPTSPLRFYPVTNAGDSVGFFANRNHYAALLTALIPITAAWMIGLIYDHRANRTLTIAVCLVGYAAWILGLGMARSRAGIALAILAAIASLLLAVTAQPHGRRRGVLVIGAATMIGGLLVVHFAFDRLIGRFDADILADLRFTIAGITGEAIWVYFPVGSGFGTFESIYRILEPREALLQSYVNHAHNDWLEALLEGGALAGILFLAFLIWFIVRGHRLWREPKGSDETLDRALAQAATITIALLLLHSLVEYPLRTTGISVLFAWSAALLIKPIQRGDANERRVRDLNHTGNKTHRHRLPRRGQNAWTRPRSGWRRSIN